jgi:hypothetical protein
MKPYCRREEKLLCDCPQCKNEERIINDKGWSRRKAKKEIEKQIKEKEEWKD